MQPKITRLLQDGITLGPLRTDEEAIGKYMEWMNDETITHWLGRNTIVTQWKDEEQWAEKEHPYTFSIYIQNPPTHIGTCAITLNKTGITADLGICIGVDEVRGKGIGRTVIQMLTRYAFNELRVHRCTISLNADNERALRCYLAAGYKECGREHEDIFHNGKYSDTLHLEMLEQDFRKWEKQNRKKDTGKENRTRRINK